MDASTDALSRIRSIDETALFDRRLGIEGVSAGEGRVEIAIPWRPAGLHATVVASGPAS